MYWIKYFGAMTYKDLLISIRVDQEQDFCMSGQFKTSSIVTQKLYLEESNFLEYN